MWRLPLPVTHSFSGILVRLLTNILLASSLALLPALYTYIPASEDDVNLSAKMNLLATEASVAATTRKLHKLVPHTS